MRTVFKPVWAAEWKKDRPKTLGSEPLMPALTALDHELAQWSSTKSDVRLNKLGLAIDAAIKAAPAAKAKCNKVLHKEGMALIDEIGRDLAGMRRMISGMEKDLQVYFTGVRKGVVGMRLLLLDVLKEPLPKKVTPAIAEAHKINAAFDKLKPPFPLAGSEAAAIPSYFGMPIALLERLEKEYNRLKAMKPGAAGIEEKKAEIRGVIAELSKQSKKGVDQANNVVKGMLTHGGS